MNTKTDGYFTLNYNGEIISMVYGKKKQGKTFCYCCDRIVSNYMETYWIDENDNEISATFGTECFKKIATWDESVIAL